IANGQSGNAHALARTHDNDAIVASTKTPVICPDSDAVIYVVTKRLSTAYERHRKVKHGWIGRPAYPHVSWWVDPNRRSHPVDISARAKHGVLGVGKRVVYGRLYRSGVIRKIIPYGTKIPDVDIA